MKKTPSTELIPAFSRKSFYGKAKVIEKGRTHYLCSYDTLVGSVDRNGKVHRYWNGRTKTTSTHIASFIDQYSVPCSVDDFYALPCEKTPNLKIVI